MKHFIELKRSERGSTSQMILHVGLCRKCSANIIPWDLEFMFIIMKSRHRQTMRYRTRNEVTRNTEKSSALMYKDFVVERIPINVAANHKLWKFVDPISIAIDERPEIMFRKCQIFSNEVYGSISKLVGNSSKKRSVFMKPRSKAD
jgi:hypothetical protein